MAYQFTAFKSALKAAEEHLKGEFSSIRTGRASPQLLDSITVDAYGARMPINQVASVLTGDARTLRISPWDQAQVKEIEKAIIAANLGISAAIDEKGIRVFFPELTAERRESLLKIAKERLEGARVAVRHERDKVWKEIQDQEKAGEMGEDEKFRAKDEMQKMVDECNKNLDALFAKKETEISN